MDILYCVKVKHRMDNNTCIRRKTMKKDSITMVKLTASEGHILTNGEHYGKIVYLASGDEGEKWYEITEKEYNEIMKKKEAETLENSVI